MIIFTTYGCVLFLGFMLGMGYVLPSIVALARLHNRAGIICVVNLLAGWLIIPWIITLLWSVSDNTNPGLNSHIDW